jgi:hypothetical protein
VLVNGRVRGVLETNDYPIDPIAWTGRGPVTISNLDRDLSMPQKSISSDQVPGWNVPYRNQKVAARVPGCAGQRISRSNRYVIALTALTKRR